MRTVLCCRQRQAPRPRRVLRVETGALSWAARAPPSSGS